MSVGFKAVQWNRDKLIYDAILLASVAVFIGSFIGIEAWLHPPKDAGGWIDLRIRAFGICAFTMLTIILSIGPLARLSPRFLPLLYNRRHFGVLTFIIAALHASFMIEWYIAQNVLPSLRDRTHQMVRLRKIHRLSVQGAGPCRAADPVSARLDQS